ncbi:hypothetical protein K0M31_000183 [Melipona bicolor]|uniref:Uncharacterized protein n=1 Tax=Melipona bicolor TaxID=60889 RepID=A0AA40GDT0_9HYME|nr:hypothetical protein K0M31_000183 [Melipona bicolor]
MTNSFTIDALTGTKAENSKTLLSQFPRLTTAWPVVSSCEAQRHQNIIKLDELRDTSPYLVARLNFHPA